MVIRPHWLMDMLPCEIHKLMGPNQPGRSVFLGRPPESLIAGHSLMVACEQNLNPADASSSTGFVCN